MDSYPLTWVVYSSSATRKPGTGSSTVDLGDLPIVSCSEIRYEQFTRETWVVQLLTIVGNRPDFRSSDLLSAISRLVPSELPDPFSKSPSELSTRSHCIIRIQPDAQA
ncbi:hypothetical protein B296_00005302 [Ensete ventricosum]|uniref:Uncharacterized protein n=1 Tax=Ensete ventricosum TaxID=4639 RepID=A0A427AVA7_ENSVE|nr:hypothetical protein B296_00005302 [Ensete ventricosum]